MSEEFVMPIMAGERYGQPRFQYHWPVTQAHRVQAQRNYSQTLERLRERGGLGWSEMEGVLTGRSWGQLRKEQDEAKRQCLALFAQTAPA